MQRTAGRRRPARVAPHSQQQRAPLRSCTNLSLSNLLFELLSNLLFELLRTESGSTCTSSRRGAARTARSRTPPAASAGKPGRTLRPPRQPTARAPATATPPCHGLGDKQTTCWFLFWRHRHCVRQLPAPAPATPTRYGPHGETVRALGRRQLLWAGDPLHSSRPEHERQPQHRHLVAACAMHWETWF